MVNMHDKAALRTEIARLKTENEALRAENIRVREASADGKLAGKFLGYISRYGANGEWLEVRTMLRRTRAYDLGVGYQRVLDALEHGGEIEQYGRGVRGQRHMVRSLFRQVTEC